HHRPALAGEQPHGDQVATAAVGRRVQALKLAAAQRRPARGDAHADARDAKRSADVVADALGERLHVALPTGREHRRQRRDGALERRAGAQRERGYAIARRRAARGIFRKYELVLDLGAGLGGTSRWLAARLGCEVIGTAASRAEADAGEALTRRAGLSPQVRLVPADPAALPFRAAHFTHVWI